LDIDQFWRSHIKLRQLRLLIAVDDHRHIGRVAAALHVTQPAVSRALAELEEGVGVELFERTRRGMVPTPAGESLIRHAREVDIHLARARDSLKSLLSGTSGSISIGSLPAAASVLLPRALALLHRQLPDVSVTVREGSFEALLPDLRARNIRFILGTLLPSRSHSDLDELALDAKPLTLVARNGHDLLARAALDWHELDPWPWILPTVGSPLRAPLEEVFLAHGLQVPRATLETTSTQLIRTFVSMTDAIAFIPSDVADYFEHEGFLRTLPLRLDGLVRPTGLVWAHDRPLDALAQRFIDCLLQASRAGRPGEQAA
jgi:DNA-binding transcriptional LysR family regulator